MRRIINALCVAGAVAFVAFTAFAGDYKQVGLDYSHGNAGRRQASASPGLRIEEISCADDDTTRDTLIVSRMAVPPDSTFSIVDTTFTPNDTTIVHDTTIVPDTLLENCDTVSAEPETLSSCDSTITFDTTIVHDSTILYDTTLNWDTTIVYDSLNLSCRAFQFVGPLLPNMWDQAITVIFRDAAGVKRDTMYYPDKDLKNTPTAFGVDMKSGWIPAQVDTFILERFDSVATVQLMILYD